MKNRWFVIFNEKNEVIEKIGLNLNLQENFLDLMDLANFKEMISDFEKIADEDGVYIPPKPIKILDFEKYPPSFICKEYDPSTTLNQPEIGYIYDEKLNAFIPPPPDPTYILNTETFEWKPDQNLEYDLHGDGKMYRWIVCGWQPVN